MFFINSNINSKIIKTRDKQILIKLYIKSIIIIPGELFIISQKKEIDKLLIKGIFKLIFSNSKEINN